MVRLSVVSGTNTAPAVTNTADAMLDAVAQVNTEGTQMHWAHAQRAGWPMTFTFDASLTPPSSLIWIFRSRSRASRCFLCPLFLVCHDNSCNPYIFHDFPCIWNPMNFMIKHACLQFMIYHETMNSWIHDKVMAARLHDCSCLCRFMNKSCFMTSHGREI